VIIIFLLLLDVYGLSLFHGTVNWTKFGTVGTWFSSVLSVIAVSFALFTIIRQKSEFEYTKSATNAARYTRIYAWLNYDEDHAGRIVVNLNLSNLTDTPIYWWESTLVVYEKETIEIASSIIHGIAIPGKSSFSLDGIEENIKSLLAQPINQFIFKFEDALGIKHTRLASGKIE
jgi:hypothetical protein